MSNDLSLSAIVAGFIAVLVGLTSSVALVFQASQAVGASAEQSASWICSVGIAMAVTSIGLSLRYRQPVLTAWSTPAAAMIAATHGISLPSATGAFVVSAVLVTLVGVTGVFERVIGRVPIAIAAALLAGVLTRFGVEAALAGQSDTALVGAMALAYVAGRRFWPRYAVPVVLAVGIAIVQLEGRIAFDRVHWAWTPLVWVTPSFDFATVLGLGVPLFFVTMASQNLPGIAAQRTAGIDVPVSPMITVTGLTSIVLAPFGTFGVNLAAITASICMGPEAHPDPRRRYVAPVVAGLLYLMVGLGGSAVVGLLTAFPHTLVVAIAGLALLATIASALVGSLAVVEHRDAAAITFLVTLSGLTLGGIGSAFWGVVAGTVALVVQRYRMPVARSRDQPFASTESTSKPRHP